LDETAEVVVVGGGAVGVSTALHLARLGLVDVVVLERATLASGATGKSAGGIRLQFADELNIRIAQRSLAAFDEIRDSIDFRQVGYLFLLSSAEELEVFRAALALQHELGVPSRELALTEAAELVPPLVVDGLVGATFCPLDGHALPEAAVQAWAAEAGRLGVRIRQGTQVESIETHGGRVVGVRTDRGSIATGAVACAAGVDSGVLSASVGVELPVRGLRRWIHFTEEPGPFPDPLPLTIDFGTGVYVHREPPGLVFGGRELMLEELAPVVERRFPALAELPVRASWWGYYDMSPDHNALVGEAAEPSRFLYACGFSGHGFQQAPAVGEYLAELIVGRTPSLDLSPFSCERFAAGAARVESFVV
jgi:sarcosine oxidase, subunit beta